MHRILPIFATSLLLWGCTTAASTSAAPDTHTTADIGNAGDIAGDATATAASDVAPTSNVQRGPVKLPVDGDPNGIWWSEVDQTLYLADDNNNRILSWTDAGGFGKAWPLTKAPDAGAGLGGLVRDKDGTLWVAAFGFGTDGAVLWLKSDGTPGKVPNLDVKRRRLGMAVDGDGQVYDSWFVKTATDRIGGVTRLDPTGKEVPVISDALKKPVGLLVKDGYLYVDDQESNQVYRCALPACASVEAFGNVATPDLMSSGPGDAVLVASGAGVVVAVRPTVVNEVVATGLRAPRGSAYDAAHKRLFIADHDPATSGAKKNDLWIVPMN